jgi:hypothetical protein
MVSAKSSINAAEASELNERAGVDACRLASRDSCAFRGGCDFFLRYPHKM